MFESAEREVDIHIECARMSESEKKNKGLCLLDINKERQFIHVQDKTKIDKDIERGAYQSKVPFRCSTRG